MELSRKLTNVVYERLKIIINEAEVVLAAIPDGILNFILALDNSGVLLFVGGIDPATESHVYWYYDRCLNVNDNLTLQIEDFDQCSPIVHIKPRSKASLMAEYNTLKEQLSKQGLI